MKMQVKAKDKGGASFLVNAIGLDQDGTVDSLCINGDPMDGNNWRDAADYKISFEIWED